MKRKQLSVQEANTLTWDFIGYNRRRAGLVTAYLLVTYHVATLWDCIVYHIEGVWNIGHSNHP